MDKKKGSSLKDVAKDAKDTGAGSYHRDIDTLKKSIAGEGEETKRFNVNMPESLHRKLRMKVAKEGTTLSELAIRLFKEYLSK